MEETGLNRQVSVLQRNLKAYFKVYNSCAISSS
jgi:hypothetical protein